MSELVAISGCSKTDRVGDVIFIRGLDGDARTTWHPANTPEAFWPKWLGEDFPMLGVWSLNYDAASLGWKGTTMPLIRRATEVLAVLDTFEIGQRPLAFITHSLGGLLVKRVLLTAYLSEDPRWKEIIAATLGIVFLST